MPIYVYRVRNEAGKELSGEAKIKNREELVTLLAGKGLTPIEIKEKNAFTDITQISFLKKRIKTKDLAIFCRQFAIILEAGVPLATAMDALREQAVNPTMKAVLNELYEDIQKGIQLSNSMKKHPSAFPEILMNMVEAGEISGQLDRVFARMAEHFEKEHKLNQKIKGAMTYPIIVSCVAAGVILIMMTKVVPSFAEILKGFGAELPIFTKILISVSNFFKNFWWLLLGGIIGLVTAGKAFSRSSEGKHFFGGFALKLPIMKNVSKIIATARFTRTLGTLLSSGVLLIQAMEVVQKVLNNIIIAEKIEYVITEIKKGKGLTQPLQALKFFPPMLISMVRIGEDSGNLDISLEKSADFYDQEVEAAMQRLTSLIEPLVIIVMAVIVAFIILSILYPMMSVYQNMA